MSPMVATASVEMPSRLAIACDEGALVVARRRDVEIIGLRADRGGLRAHRLLHRGFAALQQRRIGAGADDLAGGDR